MSQNRILTKNIEKNLENSLKVELIEFGQFGAKVKMSVTLFFTSLSGYIIVRVLQKNGTKG